MNKTLQINHHEIKIERLDKILFPESALTKADIINYYQRIAGTMIPHMLDRPVTMQRFPDGIQKKGFYQKEAPDYYPQWIQRVVIQVEEENQKQDQILCQDAATLVYLANQACITPHIWLSRAKNLDFPDKLLFDLDPPRNDFEPVRQAAWDLKALLTELGANSFLMTTGSRGLHVVVPLDRRSNFDTVRDFARKVGACLAQRHPERLTVAQRKGKRAGKLFIDYLRNAYGQNSVAPYAIRALPGAPIATPIDWDEIDKPNMNSQYYHINNIFRRLGQKKDPWQSMFADAISLDGLREKLERLIPADINV